MFRKSRTAPACKLLVVHIGDHKTGSTSIQYAFARGEVAVEGAPVAYPAELNHSFLRKQCTQWARGKGPGREAAEQAFTRLARRIAGAGAPAALISAESLENVPAEVLRDVLERFFAPVAETIRVVAYVRPHAARFLSNYAEQVKIGSFDGGLDAYFDHLQGNARLEYAPRFSAHAACQGENFVLRPMIRDQLRSGSVLEDFIHHAFGPQARVTAPAAPANESLCLEDLMRLKLLQSHQRAQNQKLRHALGWEFARLVATLPPPARRSKLVLPKGIADRLHAACFSDARALDAAFFAGQPLMERELDAARDGAPDTAQPLDPEAVLDPEELRALTLMARLAAGLLEQDGVNWVQVLRGKRVAAVRDDEEDED